MNVEQPDAVLLRLLDRLGRVLHRVDPVPDLVYEMGRAALRTRRLDEELAELVRDSAAEPAALSGVRGAGEDRLLCFESPRVEVSVEVTARDGRRMLLGHVIGADAGPVVLESALGDRTAYADSSGFFALDDVPAAPFRLRLTADGTAVVTSWVTA